MAFASLHEPTGSTFTPDDKVIHIENDDDWEVYNGDIGRVLDVDPAEGELTADLDAASLPTFGELDILPAYVATIDKSQGSKYPLW